ncbi:erythromycin esterase family protein [Streptomyces violaceusniger]|uniref:Erythromycin esterase n=1 Tax=Streptomyces violaceusniger (strain Tu 4113) TaxID=653045 RepID=G2P5F3_STRV4|nr:erythromycin esterase family protein [Streptomyces violaceusniger]AEM84766.1 Erythromycin esterase [Streptomyces violaceusniger Tu 4113]
MSERLFRDRRDAGRVLAGRLEHYRGRPDVLVLALPRGGVPVAYEVATALDAELDVLLVRKLGVPGRDEVAMGAIASGGVVVLNEDVIRGLNISPEAVRQVAEREGRELLRRQRMYRGDRPMPDIEDRTVILVDDGLATGASVRAALQALRRMRPGRIVVAVPAAPESTCQELSTMVDEVICATTPTPFYAVGASYWDFTQTTDEEVRDLLRAASRVPPVPPAAEAATDAVLIRGEALAVEDGVPQGDALLNLVGDAHFVLIGEASHGTHEFYAARARMTRRLIEEKGFCAVAAEADWPDAYRVNRYVRGRGDDATAEESLRGFERFPTWMWRNTAVLDFVGWLRDHNDPLSDGAKAGFYGLDVYSMYRSIDEVIGYLERVDPTAAARARERYACLERHDGDDGQVYGFQAAFGAGPTCEDEIVEQLRDMQRHALEYARRDGLLAEDDLFYAQRNAIVVRNAAEYYRSMFGGRVSSWNLRDRHMVDTLDALAEHLGKQRGEPAKIVVWEHNSHLGDARATESAMRGELNVGQLVREGHADDCRLLGFTTYTGTVTAADDWGSPAARKRVRPALAESVEELFHGAGEKEFLLDFGRAPLARGRLTSALLERAIGVIYRPDTERQSHYFLARVADQFDAVIHIDETRALEPLERTAGWERGEAPETYPFTV